MSRRLNILSVFNNKIINQNEFAVMQPFSFQVEDVDKRLMGMRPPDFITRLPRKIETSRKYWKGVNSVLFNI